MRLGSASPTREQAEDDSRDRVLSAMLHRAQCFDRGDGDHGRHARRVGVDVGRSINYIVGFLASQRVPRNRGAFGDTEPRLRDHTLLEANTVSLRDSGRGLSTGGRGAWAVGGWSTHRQRAGAPRRGWRPALCHVLLRSRSAIRLRTVLPLRRRLARFGRRRSARPAVRPRRVRTCPGCRIPDVAPVSACAVGVADRSYGNYGTPPG